MNAPPQTAIPPDRLWLPVHDLPSALQALALLHGMLPAGPAYTADDGDTI